MKLAAIDIGSNSIKLAVADAVDSNSFAVVTRERDVIRLGHETLRRGRLSRSPIDRAIACLQRFKTIAKTHHAEAIVTVATASVREASNAAQFVKLVGQQTGLRVETLSGVEEARLIGLAAGHVAVQKQRRTSIAGSPGSCGWLMRDRSHDSRVHDLNVTM